MRRSRNRTASTRSKSRLKARAAFWGTKAVGTRAKQLAKLRDDRVVQLPWGIRKGLFTPDGARPEAREFVHEPGACVVAQHPVIEEPLYGIDVLLEAFRLAHQVDPVVAIVVAGARFRVRRELRSLSGPMDWRERFWFQGRFRAGAICRSGFGAPTCT